MMNEMMDWAGSGFGVFMMITWSLSSILLLVLMALVIAWLVKEIKSKK